MNLQNNMISICCTTYNHQSFCVDAIKSIWNQNYKNIEIIVIDDGSTDNTAPHKQKAYKELSDLQFPITEKIHNQIISLPISSIIDIKDISYISDLINKFQ